jgi:MFS family permease
MFANPVGVLAGGWVADKIDAHDRFAAICLVGITLIAFLIAAVRLPLWALGIAFTIAGLLNGVLAPSRDMLVRKMTPPGQIGKVFGFVTSGFNVAGILTPPLFGYLLDHGAPSQVFWLAGIFCLITIPTVLITGASGRRAQRHI